MLTIVTIIPFIISLISNFIYRYYLKLKEKKFLKNFPICVYCNNLRIHHNNYYCNLFLEKHVTSGVETGGYYSNGYGMGVECPQVMGRRIFYIIKKEIKNINICNCFVKKEK